jgi:enoyl-CoA hydratase/carnithine racemase
LLIASLKGLAMSYQDILYKVEHRIATITLNRPDKLNAWTAIMEREVREAMDAAAADDGVRAIVLTGAGRGFCAGADMDLLKGLDPSDITATTWTKPFDVNQRLDYQTRYGYYPAIPKPVIGMLNGATAGIGLVHALYCDIRFAADSAVFTTAFSRRGLIAEHGLSWMLPRIVGHANAMDLLLSARKLLAPEAQAMGLVNKVFAPDALRVTWWTTCHRARWRSSSDSSTTRHSRPWQKTPARPTWRWPAVSRVTTSAKVWRISWKNAHRNSRANKAQERTVDSDP